MIHENGISMVEGLLDTNVFASGLINDAHLPAVASPAGCASLVTRNLPDFRRLAPPGLEILSPEPFVARLP